MRHSHNKYGDSNHVTTDINNQPESHFSQNNGNDNVAAPIKNSTKKSNYSGVWLDENEEVSEIRTNIRIKKLVEQYEKEILTIVGINCCFRIRWEDVEFMDAIPVIVINGKKSQRAKLVEIIRILGTEGFNAVMNKFYGKSEEKSNNTLNNSDSKNSKNSNEKTKKYVHKGSFLLMFELDAYSCDILRHSGELYGLFQSYGDTIKVDWDDIHTCLVEIKDENDCNLTHYGVVLECSNSKIGWKLRGDIKLLIKKEKEKLRLQHMRQFGTLNKNKNNYQESFENGNPLCDTEGFSTELDKLQKREDQYRHFSGDFGKHLVEKSDEDEDNEGVNGGDDDDTLMKTN